MDTGSRLTHHRMKAVHERDSGDAPGFVGCLDEQARIGGGGGKGLLANHAFACLGSAERELEMRGVRRADVDPVHGWIGDRLLGRVVASRGTESSRGLLATRGFRSGDTDQS